MSNQLNFGNKVVFIGGIPLTLPTAVADPGSAVVGDVYYNTVSNVIKYYDGAWQSLATGGGSANSHLSNLSAVAINTSLLPGADNSINLGSISFSWAGASIHALLDATGVVSVQAYTRALEDTAAATQLSWSTSGVEFNQLTASTVPFLNAGKILTSSAITPTQLGYLSPATGTTGTGNLVYSASPTFTGTVITAALNSTTGSFSGNVNMNSNLINNLSPGVSGTDAINLNQLQNALAGVQWRPAVALFDNVHTTLPATTATLIDSVTVTNGMRVLFVNLSVNNNEVYTAALSGINITWTAALDNDRVSAAPVTGDSILVEQGTVYSESAWNYNGTSWVQFNGANQVQPGNALSKTGNTLNVLYDSSTITINGSNQLIVATGGITNTQVSASAAIAFSKLAALTSAHILVGNGSNVATDVAVSGDLTLANTGAFTVAKIQGTVVSGTTGTTNVVFSTSPSITGATFSGATTLTDATTIVNATTASKVLAFNLSGMTAATTLTLSSSQSTTQTLSFPNITGGDTLVTQAFAQTLTNKTISAGGTNLIGATTISGTTGTTNVVFSNTPTISSPNISAATITGATTITDAYTVVNAATPSKVLAFSLTGMTAATTLTLSSSQSTTQTLSIPNITGGDTLVTQVFTQTLTNKTLSGNTATNLVNGAGTFNFNSTGTITAPNATDTLVGKATTDTLTNKTISTGGTNVIGATTITGTTGSGSVVFGTSPSISAATITGATTLTDAMTIVNATTASKVLAFNLSGMTAATTLTFSSSQSTTQTLTFPNITGADVLVTQAFTQTLTNKTISAGGTNLIGATTISGTTGTTNVVFSSSPTISSPSISAATITGATTITDAHTIVNATTASKVLAFNLSGMTAATTLTFSSSQSTTQTLTFPNITGADVLVTQAFTQTLTNKTLSGNTATNLVNGAGTFNFNSTGTITAPNATDTLVGKATTDTLTNKTISAGGTNLIGATTISGTTGTTNVVFSSSPTISSPSISAATITGATTITDAHTIVNATTASKVLAFNLSGMTAATTLTFSSSQSTTQTLTFPNITGADTLVTQAFAQTLTNKTISAGGTNLIGATTISGTTGTTNVVFSASPTLTGTLTVTGTETINSGATALAQTWNSTAANGTYTQWNNSGTAIGYIGAAKQTGPGTNSASDFGIGGNANQIVFSTNGLNPLTLATTGFVGVNTGTIPAQLSVVSSVAEAARIAGGNGSRVVLMGNNSISSGGTFFNWAVGVQDHVSNAFEITPSTAAGGLTFSTPSFLVDSSSNVIIGSAALTTSATNGFFYLDTCPGIPTGVPTTYTGRSAMVIDTSHNALYFYNAGWQQVSGGGGGGGSAWPTLFAATESALATAITSATSAGGGIICINGNFTMTSAHTIPTNTTLLGQDGASVITISSSGSLVMADYTCIEHLYITTALSSGTLITASGNGCRVNRCQITVPGSSTTVCINVTGSGNLFFNSVFRGTSAPSTGVGIQYTSGTSNNDEYCIFVT